MTIWADGQPADSSAVISFGRRMSRLAEIHPDKVAITFIPESGEDRLITWRELDRTALRLAHLFEERGVGEESTVVIGLKNCPEHYFSAHAAWKLGALVLPLSYRAPSVERDAVLDLARPALVVADLPASGARFPTLSAADLAAADAYPESPLPDHVPDPGKAMGSGGATGRPKIIVTPGRFAWVPGSLSARLNGITGFRGGQTHLIAGPLYHNAPFIWGHFGLFEDQSLVVFERFDAARVVDAIERHRVNFGFFSPTMMQRIARLPDIKRRDLSSIESIFHSAAPCPEWVKRAWIDLLGPEKVWEGFGSTEDAGTVWIRGDEWLEHPGAVGKPRICDLRILDANGHDVATGEVGEIHTRPNYTSEPTYYYIGSPPARTTPDGFVSVGDMGWLDADGYLHVADRRVDLIVTGGANVFPAEVEAALSSHPGLVDVAVVGLTDAEWGKRVHAIVQPRDTTRPPSPDDLNQHVREQLAPYKVPKSYEFVAELPRDPSGKVRRAQLVAERSRPE
jgi:bile acid-coenzyme A ligase